MVYVGVDLHKHFSQIAVMTDTDSCSRASSH
jgi:hypothetical protein